MRSFNPYFFPACRLIIVVSLMFALAPANAQNRTAEETRERSAVQAEQREVARGQVRATTSAEGRVSSSVLEQARQATQAVEPTAQRDLRRTRRVSDEVQRENIERATRIQTDILTRTYGLLDTRLDIVMFSGEFEQLGDAWTVTGQEQLRFQWSTRNEDAAGGAWEVREMTDGGAVVASGESSPAPQTDRMRRFNIEAGEFLIDGYPPFNTEYQVRIRTTDAAGEALGAWSNAVTITHLSEDNLPPPVDFGEGALFPSVELLALDEQVEQVPLTQTWSTHADATVRVFNEGDQATDPMFLKLTDWELLFRQADGPLEVPPIQPGGSLELDIRLEAVLPPPTSQTPQQQQVREWRRQRTERCGPQLRSVLDWRGPQSQTPITAHRESVLPWEGWGPWSGTPPSAPVCDATQCVDLCEMEKDIRAQLDGNVVGYAFVIGGPSSPTFGAGGLARTDADGAAIPFTTRTPITVASVSKWITALGALSAIQQGGSNVDAMAQAFYPGDWAVGNYFNNVTLSQFLAQRSGIMDYGNVKLDYARLETFFEQGVDNTWNAGCTGPNVQNPPNAVNPAMQGAATTCYSNYNTALFRTLIPNIAGLPVDQNPVNRPMSYANLYETFVRQNVFEAVGETDTGCRPRGAVPHAFAYQFPGDQPGFDWGDVRDECGGAGWYVSAEAMAKALFSINARDGRILTETPVSQFDLMRNRGLGLDTANGGELGKNGAWGSGGRLITTGAAIFGPTTGPNVIGVIFVNSDISGGPGNVYTVLRDAYNRAVQPR